MWVSLQDLGTPVNYSRTGTISGYGLLRSMGEENFERFLCDKFCAFFVKKDKN